MDYKPERKRVYMISISNYDDVIDSRDVIARIEDLKAEIADAAISEENGATAKEDENGATIERMTTCGDCGMTWNDALVSAYTPAPAARCAFEHLHGEIAELKVLEALAEEAAQYAADWGYGKTLIRDSYFTQYAQELADDIGAVDVNAEWPNRHIDWNAAAEELKQDYTSVDFDGVTYWVR